MHVPGAVAFVGAQAGDDVFDGGVSLAEPGGDVFFVQDRWHALVVIGKSAQDFLARKHESIP